MSPAWKSGGRQPEIDAVLAQPGVRQCAAPDTSCANRLCSPARVCSPGRSRPGTCCRSSRWRDGEPGSAPPIPARSPPARRARARSLQGWAAPAGRARCRRTPARPSGSRPPRTQGTRPRDRRRSKRTRKNMRHPPSSAPSPEAPGRPCAPGQGAQTSALHRYRVGTSHPRYNLSATQRMPPGMTRYRRDSPAADIAGKDVRLRPAQDRSGLPARHPDSARGGRRAVVPQAAEPKAADASACGSPGTSLSLSAAASDPITSQSCIKAALASSVLQRWHQTRSKEH